MIASGEATTHPASLLEVDQTTLRRQQGAACQCYRQTAVGGPLHKQTDKNPHAPLSDSSCTDRCVNWQTHALKHRDTHSAGVRDFSLPLRGQAGPCPTWSGRSGKSPSMGSFLASLPVQKYSFVRSLVVLMRVQHTE